jgi:hypothetical protein
MVRAHVTRSLSPLQKKAAKADPQIDKLARALAERRRDLPPERRHNLAKMISFWTRTFGLTDPPTE